jgi:hypothetical protein
MIITGVSSGLAGLGVGCGNGSGFGCGSGAGMVMEISDSVHRSIVHVSRAHLPRQLPAAEFTGAQFVRNALP